MFTVRRDINNPRHASVEDMRLFAVFEEIRASVKEECFNREDFFAGQVFEFGAQIDDARLVRLKLVVGEVLAVRAIADKQMGLDQGEVGTPAAEIVPDKYGEEDE